MKSPLTLAALLALLLAFPATPQARADDPSDDDRGKVMDLAFENAPIGKVIQELARLSGRNVVIAQDVTGTATVKLANVDWRQAFELLADAHGLEVQHKAGYITIVRNARPAARASTLRASPATKTRGAFGAWKDVTDKRRKAELEREIAASKARIAELEHEIAQGRAARIRDEAVVKRKAVAKRDVVVVMVHDVRDLVETSKPQIVKLIKQLAEDGTTVAWHGTNLVVRGSKHAQERLAQGLTELRADATKDVFVHKADGTRLRGRLVRKARAGDVQRLADRLDAAKVEIAAGQTRIENLARALEHLEKAGARHEAERVAKQIAEARARQSDAELRIAKLAKELDAAHLRSKRRQEDVIHVEELRFRAPGPDAGGMQGLRAEVRALRGEVRDLTALVKKLLALQGARPQGGGKGGAKKIW